MTRPSKRSGFKRVAERAADRSRVCARSGGAAGGRRRRAARPRRPAAAAVDEPDARADAAVGAALRALPHAPRASQPLVRAQLEDRCAAAPSTSTSLTHSYCVRYVPVYLLVL